MWRNPFFWGVIILLILLLFGGKRLPDLASSVGKSLKIFKKEITELQDDGTGANSAGQSGQTSPTQPQNPAQYQNPGQVQDGTYPNQNYGQTPPSA